MCFFSLPSWRIIEAKLHMVQYGGRINEENINFNYVFYV